MIRITLMLLLAGLLATAIKAELITPDVLRLSVVYAAPGSPDVTLVWKNMTDTPLTIQYDSCPVKTVTTAAGIPILMTAKVKMARYEAKLPPGGEKAVKINPLAYYATVPGEAYFVTVNCEILEADNGISYTFPFISHSVTPSFTSPWSSKVNGLIGRLRYELTADGYFMVTAELKNDGGDPISITNHPSVTLEVKDETGTPVKQIGLPVDFISPDMQTAVIPYWGVLALRVDDASVAGRDGQTILQIGNQGWSLKPGVYRISGTFKVDKGDGWHGTLAIPEVQVAVPAPVKP